MARVCIIVLGVACLVSPVLSACADESSDCGGILSNVPCESRLTPVARSPIPVSPAQQLSKKKLLLHDLTMTSLRARREFGIRVDLSKAEEICRNPSTSLDDCRSEVTRIDDRITQQCAVEAAVAASKRPPTPTAAPTPNENPQRVKIVIINNVRVIPTPRGDSQPEGVLPPRTPYREDRPAAPLTIPVLEEPNISWHRVGLLRFWQ
jgi:hypothetical protein